MTSVPFGPLCVTADTKGFTRGMERATESIRRFTNAQERANEQVRAFNRAAQHLARENRKTRMRNARKRRKIAAKPKLTEEEVEKEVRRMLR